MNTLRTSAMLCLLVLSTACISERQGASGPPPGDRLASVTATDLRAQGLSFARRGDLVRGQQYLSAAMQKGYDETVVIPELVKVCVASSRLRAALGFAEPYLQRHPDDAGMQYVVGTIHMVLGTLEEASTHLSGALQPGQLRQGCPTSRPGSEIVSPGEVHEPCWEQMAALGVALKGMSHGR